MRAEAITHFSNISFCNLAVRRWALSMAFMRNSALCIDGTIAMSTLMLLLRLLLLLVVGGPTASWALAPVSLQTSVRLRASSSDTTAVRRFLATPANWPRIVLSSWAVVVPSDNKSNTSSNNPVVEQELRPGDTVDEIFGLPPILPLTVRWTCVASTAQSLDVQSAPGVEGLARDCRMLFEYSSEDESSSTTVVQLTMEYQPVNLLGVLAIPVLALDNAIALKVLLPNALQRSIASQSSSLDDFRGLMGVLYGIAGLAHAADCLWGNSQLLVAVGCPGFYELPTAGQALTVAWFAVGPLAFLASRAGGRMADSGLLIYGLIEVACSACVAAFFGSTAALAQALAVQAVVAASWVYSRNKEPQL